MYYVMDWRGAETALGVSLAEVDIVPVTDIPWTMGLAWGAPLSKPIELVFDPDSGTALRDAFLVGIPCFSRRLIDRLKALGVDNFEEFDVVLTDPRTGQRHLDYRAVNIVGLVECADLSASTFFPGSSPPLMDFTRLVLDERKAGQRSLFRLGEAAGTILVSERVARALEQEHLVGVRFQPVAASTTR